VTLNIFDFEIRDRYALDEARVILEPDGRVPLVYWRVAPNFGDALSPWLVGKLTGLKVKSTRSEGPNYVAIGSVIEQVKDKSEVWGSGSFGTERVDEINASARYHAVRGPLTRSLLRSHKITCPRVYGDPALLTPLFYRENVEKRYRTGLAVRWRDNAWKNLALSDEVLLIDFHSSDIEMILYQMLSCERIVTSSLHGLIIADAYGLPSAWLSTRTAKGHEFKYYDYFLSVNKARHARHVQLSGETLLDNSFFSREFEFDNRAIEFDPHALLDSCPFLKSKD